MTRKEQEIYIFSDVQNVPGAHSASYTTGTGDPSPGSKASGAWCLLPTLV